MISGGVKAAGLETLAVKGLAYVDVFWSVIVEPYVEDFGTFSDAYVDDFGAVNVVDENARGVFRMVVYVVSYPRLVDVLYMGVLESSS